MHSQETETQVHTLQVKRQGQARRGPRQRLERRARRRTRWIGQGGEAGDGDWEVSCDGRREEVGECGWGRCCSTG